MTYVEKKIEARKDYDRTTRKNRERIELQKRITRLADAFSAKRIR